MGNLLPVLGHHNNRPLHPARHSGSEASESTERKPLISYVRNNLVRFIDLGEAEWHLHTMTCDAEKRLMKLVNGRSGETAAFTYDADGKRVKATFGSSTTVYVGDYYEQAGSTVRRYSYANGQRVTMRENGTLYYLLTDHLGSRAITADSSGTPAPRVGGCPPEGGRRSPGGQPPGPQPFPPPGLTHRSTHPHPRLPARRPRPILPAGATRPCGAMPMPEG